MGVTKECHIVCYDDADGFAACQAAWYFQLFGFAGIQVLNAKFQITWPSTNAQKPSVKNEAAKQFEVKRSANEVVDFAFVKQAVAWTEYVIIDCRSKELFEKGSVLKAINLERSEVMGDHSALKIDELNKVLKDKKLALSDKNIIIFGCAASNVKAVFEYY